MMMRLKVQKVGEGLHPSEVVVAVQTADGMERLIVHQRSLLHDSLEIGYPIGENREQYLVELPRETTTGSWRVWVKKDNVMPVPA